MSFIARLLATAIDIFTYLILINIIASWVLVLRVRLPDFVIQILAAINSVVEPVMAPVRRLMPNMGGLDFSPIIVLVLLQVISGALHNI